MSDRRSPDMDAALTYCKELIKSWETLGHGAQEAVQTKDHTCGVIEKLTDT